MNITTGGYLFAYFTGESSDGEQIYFALSRDGLHWTDLNSGFPVLRSDMGEKGVRDPFLLKSQIDEQFYLIATDLRIANGRGWKAAQESGSTQMILWRSEDLIHWSKPWAFSVGIPGAGCVWAPEAIYDPKREAYLVFWASKTAEPGEMQRKHRIYCSYTCDFVTFTEPVKYIERTHDVIDTTIVKEDDVFYRFSKDETTKNIRIDCGTDLMGAFTEVESTVLNGLMGVEGPAAFWSEASECWCLLVDQFAKGLGYLPLTAKTLKCGDFQIMKQDQYHMGKNKKRHGSVLPLSEAEYGRVEAYWKHDQENVM